MEFKVAELTDFLAKTAKMCGPSGNEQETNLTDPKSAKLSSSHGVVQGYNGLAVVDDKNQVVVHAEAHGSGYEAHLLAPLIEATQHRKGGSGGNRAIAKGGPEGSVAGSKSLC